MNNLKELAKLIRYYILTSTTEAGSGHPTSSLSATELTTALLFGRSTLRDKTSGSDSKSGFFRFNIERPKYVNNDRLIFSKGHASPLFYALWAAAGKVSLDELLTLRKFGSRLEGHPTLVFPFTEAATGSLGQGLSIGVGMALNAKLDNLTYKTFVLLGDSEMAEGSVWEAVQSAAYYKLDNLIAVLDVNRLGQRGETMYGHNLNEYQKRLSASGWLTIVINGHDLRQITSAYKKALLVQSKPVVIIAKTFKGKGVRFFEDKDDWHGKALPKEELKKALAGLGRINKRLIGKIELSPKARLPQFKPGRAVAPAYLPEKPVATRRAYGNALLRLLPKYPEIVVLDAEVSNSTYAEIFKKAKPERFFEMFIAEQNMAGVALGFSRRGKIPFVSTFAAFLTRAFDQIRMAQYSNANIKFVGSHAGVSIGEDGSSQMALEDLAMFRSVLSCVVLYPSDAYATERLVEAAASHNGMVYIRTTRKDTPIIYSNKDRFVVGGSKVLRKSGADVATVVGAGVTLYEALAAYEELQRSGINIRVIDLYSVKPLDLKTLLLAAKETKAIVTVEDHYPAGGIGEAVSSALSSAGAKVYSLAVNKMPKSGKPDELLAYEGINSQAIIKKVKEIIKRG